MAGLLWTSARKGQAAIELVARMLARERHRGPDDDGVARLAAPGGAERGAIGTVRLAILDPSPSGHQPMVDPTTGNHLVFNGELYNHLEVRRELDDGEPWCSGSDTETLLRAYRRWGFGCLERFRGMFAFAIWDDQRQEMWCARDRLGIKPLYYSAGAESFVFASEVRALLAAGVTPRRLDPQGLASFVRFGAVSEPRTIIEDVRSLPAGDWIRVRDGRIVEQRPYWRPRATSGPYDRERAAETIRSHLSRAVEEHMLADVPVAAFLSGGLDSSIVTALAARASGGLISTFTLGFNERGHDESGFAEAIARHCKTQHSTILLNAADVATRVPLAVRAMDQPSVDGVNTWLISQVVADAGFKVVLSGLGGDELFGGYPSFRWVPRAARLARLLRLFPKNALARATSARGRLGRAASMIAPERTLAARYEQVRALWSDGELHALGVPPNHALAISPDDGGTGPAAVSLLELAGYMRSTLLRDADAMSMSLSLELRVPFLDHLLVQACLDVGAAGVRRSGVSKPLLLEASAGLLPGHLFDRPKRGFALPMEQWMRGPLSSFVEDGLSSVIEAGSLPAVASLRQRFHAQRLPWARLWQFVVLGQWLRAQGVSR